MVQVMGYAALDLRAPIAETVFIHIRLEQMLLGPAGRTCSFVPA